MSFYNTINESGQLLFDFRRANDFTDTYVVDIFKKYPDRSFTPYQIADELIKMGITNMLQSSIKRSITDSTKAGILIKTDVRVKERYGKVNYTWKLNK